MNEPRIYHVFNRSIANYTIFNSREEYSRMMTSIRYYSHNNLPISLSYLLVDEGKGKLEEIISDPCNKIVNLIAYCLMPTHLHLILELDKEKFVSIFMNNLQNSYTRFFNLRHKRRGPLWEGRYKKVLVKTDEQLLHLTRYVHLNPVTANLIRKPEDWEFSSYKEYLGKTKEKICSYEKYIDVEVKGYKKFNEDRIGYQRQLAQIKKYLFDEPM
ncbi:transposase [Candidatus Omnitrophota bacterium]